MARAAVAHRDGGPDCCGPRRLKPDIVLHAIRQLLNVVSNVSGIFVVMRHGPHAAIRGSTPPLNGYAPSPRRR